MTVKLDADTLRKLALLGAQLKMRDLQREVDDIRTLIKQLGAASSSTKHRPLKVEKKHRRKHSPEFKAMVAKEVRASNNASEVAKKHKLSASLVRTWVEKAK